MNNPGYDVGECEICNEEDVALYRWPNDECIHMFCQGCTLQIKRARNLCPICQRPPREPVFQVPDLPQQQQQQQQHEQLRQVEDDVNMLSHSVLEALFLHKLLFPMVYTIIFIMKICLVCLTALASFVNNNSPFQWLFWFFTTFYVLVVTPPLFCRPQDLPEILSYYDVNNTMVFSMNISMVKQMFLYSRVHSIVLEGLCSVLIK
ncbi:MAG: RING finger protein [Nitrosomonas sp.]|nr:RING finger protein [Nitrosomonas sp.]